MSADGREPRFAAAQHIDLLWGSAHTLDVTDGEVVGVDFAPHMIERAKRTAAEAGLTETTHFNVTDLGAGGAS